MIYYKLGRSMLMRKMRSRCLAALLAVFIFFAGVMIPDLRSDATTNTIALLLDSVESSVDDYTYVHYLYSPTESTSAVEATIRADSTGESKTSTLYAYGKAEFAYVRVTIKATGTYTVTLKEKVLNSSGNWVESGVVKTCKVTVRGKKTGWSKTNGKWCYYNSSGKRLYEWQKIDGKWYYLEPFYGGMLTGWNTIKGKRYYFLSSGAAVTGWKKISGKWYYFKNDCAMVKGKKKIGGKTYYFNNKGVMLTKWQTINNKKYYFGTDGVMRTGWQKISGKRFHFTAKGVMQTGWKKLSGKWYYFRKNGAAATGTLKIKGKTYKFTKTGVCKNKK